MTSIAAYKNGLKWSVQNIKLWGWLYFGNFLLAALAAIPLMNLLEEKLEHTLASRRLMEGFDFTVFTDFIHEYGAALLPVFSQTPLLIIVYLFLSVFFMGGILAVCKRNPQKVDFQLFAVGAIQYFWRIFRMSLYFLILHGLLIMLFGTLFMLLIKGGDLKQLDSELVIYTRGMIILAVYLFFAGLLVLIQDFSKIEMVENNHKIVVKSIKIAVITVFRHFKSIFVLALLNWFGFGLIALLYLWLRGDDLNHSVTELWMIFILGQFFILLRMGLKVLNLASKTLLYKNIQSKISTP